MRCVRVIPMQFHFITYGMELYTNDSIPINTNIEQCMCMRASGASELRKFWHFYILKLFLSIFCRYIHWQITCIPRLNFIRGGGGQAPPQAPPPPPPPVRQCHGRTFKFLKCGLLYQLYEEYHWVNWKLIRNGCHGYLFNYDNSWCSVSRTDGI